MGTSISLREGEEISVRDLLYAVLVAGANDAVCVLAYHIAGNVTAFVNMMNGKVRELGCKNTFYTNCTGVHDVNMVTTAEDTLKIALYAYTNSNFMAMSSETSYTIEPTNKTFKERKIYNRNFIVSTQYYTLYYNSLAKGMNAGYTSDGGYCLVTSLRKKGCTYIVVCMGARTDSETQRIHTYTDCETLVNWAYDNYDFVSLVDQTTMICELPVTLSSDVDYVTLLPAEPIEMFLPKDIDVSTAVKLNYILLADSIEAPIKEGEIAGVLTAHYNDKPVATVNLVTKDNVSRIFGYTMTEDNTPVVKTVEEKTQVGFWFKAELSADAYTMLADGAAGLTVGATMQWTPTGGEAVSRNYVLSAEQIIGWAGVAGSGDYWFYVNVTGFESLTTTGTLKVMPTVNGVTGNAIAYSVN
jgi:D-alanyl-D-alanine carboxypeptidase